MFCHVDATSTCTYCHWTLYFSCAGALHPKTPISTQKIRVIFHYGFQTKIPMLLWLWANKHDLRET